MRKFILKNWNKGNKYRNTKVEYKGLKFDSKKEYYFYLSLTQDKKVANIELQPFYVLQPSFKKNGKTVKSITYRADFKVTYKDGTEKIIDVKGFKTKEFNLKKKMFDYRYPDLSIEIV